MLNQSGVTKQSATNVDQILFATQNQVSVSIVAGNTGITADTNGKKILKAGTPLTGNLDARTTAFTKAASTGTPLVSNAVGVLLHDVDVTAGNANAQLLIFGFVNTNRVDTATKALITAEAKSALKMIQFIAA